MVAIHAIERDWQGVERCPAVRRVMLAVQCAVSDGGRYRSGDLISVRPSVRTRNLKASLGLFPEACPASMFRSSMFQGVQQTQ